EIAPIISCATGTPFSRNTNSGLCTYKVVGSEFNATATDNCSTPTLAWSVTGATTISGDTTMDGFDLNFGTNTITWTAKDACGNTSTCSITVSINNVNTTTSVTVTPNTQQYSDKVTLTATVTNCNGNATGGIVTFKIGTQTMGTALVQPDGTATLTNVLLLEPSYTSGTATPPNGQMAPGVKVVTATFAAYNNSFASSGTASLSITKENAEVYYTGSSFVSTSTTTSSTATVTLSATIRDINAEINSGDANPGDIRNARVRFVNRDLTPTSISSPTSATGYYISDWLTVGLVSPGDTKTGSVTANWIASIGNSDAQQFTIGVVVDNGYYIRNESEDNSVITVSKPLTDFVTGGGYIITSKAIGKSNPLQGKKNNFGFNIKRNKNGALQGNINTIIRTADGKVIQVKGNAMSSLSVSPATASSPGKAVFNGKANIQDITNPLAAISLDGNATLQVSMTDRGEPGKNDDISIMVWDKNSNVWFSSNWSGTSTSQQVLDGGNIKIQSTGSFATGTTSSAVSIVSSLTTSTVGQAVTFTATVTGNLTTKPTGTVNFVDVTTNTVLGNVAINSTTGVASLLVGSLTAGNHEIAVYYGGNSKYAASSNSLTQIVNAAITSRTSMPVIVKQVKETPIVAEPTPFNVIAYPNPAKYQFTLVIEGGSKEKVDVVLYDVLGRTVKHIESSDGQPIQFGEELPTGAYFTIVSQGVNQKTVRLIKQ
ncbi:Ig-like domain repeat protein, partial [Flavobacterium sp.]|uniref:Ig-like domain repeat protein n=1 Tax=Flavobacterium sp. TaxID=239 RepID=UPI0025C05C78